MTRKQRLQLLADEYHRSKYGDYVDTYEQFAAAYGLKYEDEVNEAQEKLDIELEPIPRYVFTTHDETYSMLNTSDSIEGALNGLLAAVGSETLNIPGFLIDLDTGDTLGYYMSIKATGKVQDNGTLFDYLKEDA